MTMWVGLVRDAKKLMSSVTQHMRLTPTLISHLLVILSWASRGYGQGAMPRIIVIRKTLRTRRRDRRVVGRVMLSAM